MGGFNSGRHGGKKTTDDMLALDIRKLQRDGVLIPGERNLFWTCNGEKTASINIRTHNDRVTLDYRVRDRGGELQAMNYPVAIEWTPCNYGGKRAWFKCPCCERRVAVLYSDKIFACRQCKQLVHKSTRTAPDSKCFARVAKLRERLGWCAYIFTPPENKPKGMHWKTYEQLLEQLSEHSIEAMQSLARQVERDKKRMSKMDDLTW